MPRGFLIKRKKHHPESWFSRRGSEESEQSSEQERLSPSLGSSNGSEEALNLSTKNHNNVFNESLDLVTRKSSSGSSSPQDAEKTRDFPPQQKDEAVNLCKIYLEASKKVQQLVDKERLSEEFNNNNFLRHPLAEFNRESFQHYLPNGLPSSAPLSISTGSSWSPFYLSAFDHLSVTSSPSASSHGSSPRSAPVMAPVPSPQQKPTQNIPQQGKKRSHAAATGNPGSQKAPHKSSKKMKAVRKIEFNDSSSPVSGTYIREESDDGIRVVSGDIDTNLNIVEVTPEAQAELAKIENKIGDYRCRLCKDMFENAFGLAQHRCSRIVHVEYRCPECDKVFNCSANLASHRRWHKPRQPSTGQSKLPLPKLLPNGEGDGEGREAQEGQFPCTRCGKHFKRQAYLRKHMATHSPSVPQGEESASGETTLAPPLSIPQSLVCRLCGSQVADHLALEEHIRHHHRTDMFACKLCSASCFNLSGLSEHVRKCHPATHPPLVMLQMPPLSRPC